VIVWGSIVFGIIIGAVAVAVWILVLVLERVMKS